MAGYAWVRAHNHKEPNYHPKGRGGRFRLQPSRNARPGPHPKMNIQNRGLCVFFLILCATSAAYASNEAYVTVDSKDAGLCLGLDTPDVQTCQNQTLLIDGTSDHVLYILPQSEISNPGNSTQVAQYAFFQPVGIVISAFGYVMFLIMLFAGVIYIMGGAFNRYRKYKK
jgi:hypothetical protein